MPLPDVYLSLVAGCEPMIDTDSDKVEPPEADCSTQKLEDGPAEAGAPPKSGTLFQHKFGIAPCHLDEEGKAGADQNGALSPPVEGSQDHDGPSSDETG
jgi:hypothetical protein